MYLSQLQFFHRRTRRDNRKLPELRVVDEFGGEISVVRATSKVRVTCKRSSGSKAELRLQTPVGGSVVSKPFMDSSKGERVSGMMVFHLQLSKFKELFKDRSALCCKADGVEIFVTNPYVGYFYHLCGKEECQKKRCAEGQICIITNDTKASCRTPVSGSDRFFCDIHKPTGVSSMGRDLVISTCMSETVLDTNGENAPRGECEALLFRGKIPRFTTTESEGCSGSNAKDSKPLKLDVSVNCSRSSICNFSGPLQFHADRYGPNDSPQRCHQSVIC